MNEILPGDSLGSVRFTHSDGLNTGIIAKLDHQSFRLYADGQQVGELKFSAAGISFNGNADESAHLFLKALSLAWPAFFDQLQRTPDVANDCVNALSHAWFYAGLYGSRD